MDDNDCDAVRYAPRKRCGPVTFRVVYRIKGTTHQDSHPACFVHGLAEVERHHASGGMASCDLEPADG